jgi:hypothetical protein
MFFSGSLQSPVVVATPGLNPPSPRTINRVDWGENVDFSVPDPGADCTLLLVIKLDTEDDPVIEQSYERTSDEGDITFTILGADSIRYLEPGVYLFQVVKITDTGDPPLQYSFYPEGKFEIWESAGSRSIAASEADLDEVTLPRPSYPPTDMFLVGSCAEGQVFGFYRAPVGTGLEIIKVTITAQTAPDGSDLAIDLIDEGAGALCTGITLPDGERTVEVELENIAVPANGIIRCRVSSPGETPAENLSVRIHFQL